MKGIAAEHGTGKARRQRNGNEAGMLDGGLMAGKMDDIARAVLREIVLGIGPAPFTLQEAAGVVGQRLAPADLLLILRRLMKTGEIEGFRKSWGDLCYAVPFDRCRKLAVAWAKPAIAADARIAETEAEPDGRAEGKDIALDLLAVLDDIERRTAKLTRKGRIEQKTIERWSRLIRLGSGAAASAMPVALSPYPVPVAMVLDLLLRNGFICFADGQVRTDHDRIMELLAIRHADFRRMLYDSWLRVWCPDEAGPRLIGMMLPHLPAGDWISAERLLRRCFEPDGSAAGCGHGRQELDRFLSLSAACGWLETGISESGEAVFRPLRFAAEEESCGAEAQCGERCYVQSDLDVIVPPGVSYAAHWLLLKIAEPVVRDQTAIYRLSRNRAEIAWRQGWNSDKLIDELNKRAFGGVPEPVQREIAEWERLDSGIRLEPTVTIRFRDRALADEIASLPEVKSRIGENQRLSDGSLVISAEFAETMRGILATYGYSAQRTDGADHFGSPNRNQSGAGGDPAAAADSTAGAEERPMGLFRFKFDTSMFRPLERLPDRSELFPGLDRVPAAWLKNCRPYHPSTVLDIVRRAIEWQCYVKVRTAEGDRLIIPAELLEGEGAGAGFRGHEDGRPAEVCIRDLAGIQLVLSLADQI